MAFLLNETSPPSLRSLLEVFVTIDGYNDFCVMVRMALPEHATEILAGPVLTRKVEKFISYFEAEVCELYEDGIWQEFRENGWAALAQSAAIPLIVYGLTEEDYHNLGLIGTDMELLGALVQPRHAGNLGQEDAWGKSLFWKKGGYEYVTPYYGSLRKCVGPKLAGQFPKGGLPQATLQALCEGTKYAGLLDIAHHLRKECRSFLGNVSFDDGTRWRDLLWNEPSIAFLKEQQTLWLDEQKRMLELREPFTTLLEQARQEHRLAHLQTEEELALLAPLMRELLRFLLERKKLLYPAIEAARVEASKKKERANAEKSHKRVQRDAGGEVSLTEGEAAPALGA